MRVWVTRAEPGAAATAERLRALGHEPVVLPLLRVRALDAALSLEGIAALAFTSANGVAAFIGRESRRDMPVFAVGDATAEAARAAGFSEVASAAGDVEALVDLIAAAAPGPVLHPGARQPAGDLIGGLAARGVTGRAVPLYDTVETPPPSAPAVDAVLAHSPRAAAVLARFAALAGAPVFCISGAAAAPLRAANFTALAIAPFPNEAALLKLLDEPRAG